MSSNLIGKRLDGFEIIRVLGRGGMGVVYKAHEMTLQRVIALKVLPQHLAENKEFITRFYREARAAAQLNHNNVVTIFRVGEDDGHHYIAMEYLKGRELTEIIKERKQIDIKEAVDIARQVASALAAAHELGILHRDIKPHNVMLDEQGRVKVMDFGIAKLNEPGGDGSHGITMTGQLLGTPAYMSPEQCKGATADARSDIYSLGVVLYQAIAGKVPYTGETPLAVMRKIVEEPMPDIRTLRNDVPDAVVHILERSLSKEPEQRYANAAEMEEDCRKYLGGQDISTMARTESSLGALPTSEPKDERPAPRPKTAKKKPPVALVAAVCLVAMVGVGALTFLKLKQRQPKPGDGGGTEIASGTATPTGGSQAIILPANSPAPKETPQPTETPRPTAPPTVPPSPSPKPNRKPSASLKLSASKAGPDDEVVASFKVEDEDGDPLDFSYRLNGSPWIKLKPSEIARTEFKVAGFKEGENVIELRADDGQENATAKSTLTVEAKPKPVATQMAAVPVIPKTPVPATPVPQQPGQQAGPLGDALKGHTNNVTCVAAGGGLAISGSQDNTAIIWDLKTGEKRATLSGHALEVSSVAISPDGKMALTGSKDNTVRVWDTGGKELRRFENHSARVIAVAFSADGKSAMSASDDGQICKWDPNSGGESARLAAGKINCAAFSGDGRLAVTGNATGAVQLWDVDAKSVRSTFEQKVAQGIGHARAVFAVALSADGRRALSGGQDARICVWDAATGAQQRQFEGHKNGTQAVAFSADGAYAISGGKDKGVAIWDLETGDQVQAWFNHSGSVLGVVGAAGGLAVSGSVDQSVRRWRL